jgi:hypothetical protein
VGGLNYVPNFDPLSSETRLVLLHAPLVKVQDDVGRAASEH